MYDAYNVSAVFDNACNCGWTCLLRWWRLNGAIHYAYFRHQQSTQRIIQPKYLSFRPFWISGHVCDAFIAQFSIYRDRDNEGVKESQHEMYSCKCIAYNTIKIMVAWGWRLLLQLKHFRQCLQMCWSIEFRLKHGAQCVIKQAATHGSINHT